MTIPKINVYRNRHGNLGYSGIGDFKMQFPLHAMESKCQDPIDPEFVNKLRRDAYKGDKPIAEITSDNVSTERVEDKELYLMLKLKYF